MRLGVALSPKQADIFDMIARKRPNEQIFWVLFPNSSKLTARKTLHVHVWQINQKLLETDYRIHSDRDGSYVLQRTSL